MMAQMSVNMGKEKLLAMSSWTILCLTALVCTGYSIFTASFAENHLLLPFLGWPLFVGEMLLFVVTGIFVFSGMWRIVPRKMLLFCAALFLWIVGEASWGFRETGLFSFRNAAMFYYAFFTGLVYYSYCSVKPSKFFCLMASFLLSALIFLKYVDVFFLVTCFVLLGVALSRWCSKRWIVTILIVLFALSQPGRFFLAARTHLVSVGVFVLFLCLIWGGDLLRKGRYWLCAGVAVLLAMAMVFSVRMVDGANLETLTQMKVVLSMYHQLRAETRERVSMYIPPPIPVAYYHDAALPYGEDEGTFQKNMSGHVLRNRHASQDETEILSTPPTSSGSTELETYEVRLSKKYANALFRVLIWRDMVSELGKDFHWLAGLGFGSPVRSRTLEVLRWGESEWKRDGWIAPHNSYLHVFYRAGLIGLLLMGLLFLTVGKMVLFFIRSRSWRGLLLSGAILYWIVAANFILVLELPYYAIPFWALLGGTMAYWRALAQAPRSSTLDKGCSCR